MSACMSDVDLATLHKCRLEQRIKYQLSAGWVNRRGLMAANRSRTQISNLSQPTACNLNAEITNQAPPSVIEPCVCCRCVADDDDNKCRATEEQDNSDEVATSGKCACQRSSTPLPIADATVEDNSSNQVDGINDKRKVGNRRNCKHAVISCPSNKEAQATTGDKDSYLTRRRSGTWP